MVYCGVLRCTDPAMELVLLCTAQGRGGWVLGAASL